MAVLLPSTMSMNFLTLVLFLLSASFSMGQTVVIQNVPPEALRLAQDAGEAEARADWQAAEQNYLKAISLAPMWAEVRVNLAAVYNRQARGDKAIDALKQAAEIKPELVEAHLNLGITYFKAARYTDAGAESETRACHPA